MYTMTDFTSEVRAQDEILIQKALKDLAKDVVSKEKELEQAKKKMQAAIDVANKGEAQVFDSRQAGRPVVVFMVNGVRIEVGIPVEGY